MGGRLTNLPVCTAVRWSVFLRAFIQLLIGSAGLKLVFVLKKKFPKVFTEKKNLSFLFLSLTVN